jgi:hypothetical protein
MIVVSFLAFSNAVLFLMSNPCIAAAVVDMATTKGIATPRACGHDVTITVTILSKAKARLWFTYQTIKVVIPTTIDIIVSHLATLSARFWVFDLALCADCTNVITLFK